MGEDLGPSPFFLINYPQLLLAKLFKDRSKLFRPINWPYIHLPHRFCKKNYIDILIIGFPCLLIVQ